MVLFINAPGFHEWKCSVTIYGDMGSSSMHQSINSPSMGTGQIKVADGPNAAEYDASCSLSVKNSMNSWQSFTGRIIVTPAKFSQGESGSKSITITAGER